MFQCDILVIVDMTEECSCESLMAPHDPYQNISCTLIFLEIEEENHHLAIILGGDCHLLAEDGSKLNQCDC